MPVLKKIRQGLGKLIKKISRSKTKADTYCVGIDLGTTKTSVGYMSLSRNQKIGFINFTDDGDSPLPSVVALERPSAEMSNPHILKAYLGEDILKDNRAFLRDKDSLATWGIYPRAKLSIGKGSFDKDDYPESLLKRFPEVTPEDIIACILSYVRIAFKKQVHQDLLEATITVPASWDPEQRRATKMAAYMAGFKNVFLLEEPIAALLKVIDVGEYKNRSENIMIVDFGGGTCDVAIVAIENDEIRLKGTGAKNRLGGELVDEILLEDFIIQIKGDSGLADEYKSNETAYKEFLRNLRDLEDDANIRSSLRRQLEILKREINKEMINRSKTSVPNNSGLKLDAAESMDETLRNLQSNSTKKPKDIYYKPISVQGIIGTYEYALPYVRFSKLLTLPRPELPQNLNQQNSDSKGSMSVISAFDAILKDVLEAYNPTKEKIGKVFLVGGSSYLYFVKERIHEKLFHELKAKEVNEKIQARKNREDAVVEGATLYDFQRRSENVIFKSKLFYNLQIEGDESTLIEENIPIDIDGYETGAKLYTLKVTDEVPPEKPVRFRLIRSGGTIGKKSISKEIEHSMPIRPKQELQLKFRVTSDSIIFIEGKDFVSDEILKSKETYPVIPEEGLQKKVDAFRMIFTNLIN